MKREWWMNRGDIKRWKAKQNLLYRTIVRMKLACSVEELWDYYLSKYFTSMELRLFCKVLEEGKIKYEILYRY